MGYAVQLTKDEGLPTMVKRLSLIHIYEDKRWGYPKWKVLLGKLTGKGRKCD